MSDAPDVADLLRAIAAGSPIDWDGVDVQAVDASLQPVLVELRLIAQVAEVHGSATRVGSDGSAPDGDNESLKRWGSLTLLERIGRGSYGDVYRAWDPRLEREVAVKLLPPGFGDGHEREASVIDEARWLARVRHPNVATVYGADYLDGRTGIWMEFVNGRDLRRIVRDDGPLSPASLCDIGQQLCEALSGVHAAGLLHRDVNAQNVMLQDDGRVVLMDFGAGRALREDDRGTDLAGTPVYLAPELFEGQHATAQSDVYSVGVLLHYLLTGAYPVAGRTIHEIRANHRLRQRVTLSEAGADVPTALTQVVERALDDNPDRRYATAADMGNALLRVSSPARSVHRRLMMAGAAVVVGLVVLGTAAVRMARGVREAQTFGDVRPVAPALTAADGSGVSAPQTPAADPSGQRVEETAPTLRFAARDWVLIVPFENRTGEAVLDGTLEFALERELANSAFVNVAPRERIEDVLRLMRRPIETKVDARLGREIALRDGGVRALVTGRVETIGTAYVITSRIVDPADGVVITVLSEEALARPLLLSAVRRQALKVRTALGEMLSTVKKSEAALDKVTTPSLHALQLYSQASAFMHGDNWKHEPAEQLLREAVSEDPDFASAHILLAWAIHNQQRPAEEFLPYANQAAAFAQRTSDAERYFILGSYHSLMADALNAAEAEGHRRQAVSAYEALMRIKPDHYWGVVNLWHEYLRLCLTDPSKEAEADKWLVRSADIRSTELQMQMQAAGSFLEREDIERVRHFVHRIDALTPSDFGADFSPAALGARLLKASASWLGGDVRRVRQVIDEIVRQPGQPPQQFRLDARLVSMYVGLGRFRDAESAWRRFAADGIRGAPAVYESILWERAWLGDEAAKEALPGATAEREAENGQVTIGPSIFIPLSMADELRSRLTAAKRATRAPGNTLDIEGQLAVTEGRLDDGLRLLEEAKQHDDPHALLFQIQRWARARAMAQAWEVHGDLREAAKVLADATDGHRGECARSVGGLPFWIYARDKLSQLYRRMGRVSEAQAIDADLRKLLAVAEEDHPVLVRLRQADNGNRSVEK
jgi:serine/threonine-protein kinase